MIRTADLSLKQACSILGVTRQTFVRWATDGFNGRRLHAWKVGSQWRTNLEAIEAFKSFPGASEAATACVAPAGTLKQRATAARAQIRKEFGS